MDRRSILVEHDLLLFRTGVAIGSPEAGEVNRVTALVRSTYETIPKRGGCDIVQWLQ
jgi:hypothetical protein